MNKNLPKKAKDIKGAVAIAELKRAHAIIIILALAFAAMLTAVLAFDDIIFNDALGAVAITLLAVVAAVSYGTLVALKRR